MKLSTESGRFSDYVNGKSFAIIGGRGTPSPDDIARGTLLFEAAVLTRFSKQPSPKPPYSSSVPPPPNWVGVNGAQHDGGGWGEQCLKCEYWGPALVKTGGGVRDWKCLSCVYEQDVADTGRNQGVDKGDLMRLQQLKCHEVSYENIFDWPIEKVKRRSAFYKEVITMLMSDQKPTWNEPGNGQNGGQILVDKRTKETHKVKDVTATFSDHKNLKLPLKPEKVRKLQNQLESEFNMRLASSSPTMVAADTSRMISAIVKLSSDVLQKQLDHLFEWITSVYGPTESLMGFHMVMIAIRSASRLSDVLEESSIYEKFLDMKMQKSHSLAQYIEQFDAISDELNLARHGIKVEDKLTMYLFLLRMDPTCKSEVLRQQKSTFKGRPMTWASLRTCIDTLSDMTGSGIQSGGKSLNALVQQQVEQQFESVSQGLVTALEGQGVVGAVTGGNEKRGYKGTPKFLPKYPCELCNSTKDSPKPSGSEHHYESDCPFWKLSLKLDDNGDVEVRHSKIGNHQFSTPMYVKKQKEDSNYVPRWQTPQFKTTKSYDYLKRMKEKNVCHFIGAKNIDQAISSTKKKGGRASKKQKTSAATGSSSNSKAANSESSWESRWSTSLGLNAIVTNRTPQILTVAQAGLDEAHEIFRVDPSLLQMSEEEVVRGFGSMSQMLAEQSGSEMQFRREGENGELIACYLMAPLIASNMTEGNLPARDSALLANYNPSKAEVESDKQRAFVGYGSQDGACQRSIELYVPLKDPTPKATHVKWDQMLDLGAVGTYMAASLMFKFLQYCSRDDTDATIVKMGFYKKPERINGADPTAEDGMHTIAWIKIKVNSKLPDGTTFTQELKYDVLNRSAVQDLRGASQQSKDEGYPDIHDQITSANSRPEYYVVRSPTVTSAGTVRIPLHRRINTWGALIMPVFSADDLTFSKQIRTAQFMLNSVISEEKDEVFKVDMKSVDEISEEKAMNSVLHLQSAVASNAQLQLSVSDDSGGVRCQFSRTEREAFPSAFPSVEDATAEANDDNFLVTEVERIDQVHDDHFYGTTLSEAVDETPDLANGGSNLLTATLRNGVSSNSRRYVHKSSGAIHTYFSEDESGSDEPPGLEYSSGEEDDWEELPEQLRKEMESAKLSGEVEAKSVSFDLGGDEATSSCTIHNGMGQHSSQSGGEGNSTGVGVDISVEIGEKITKIAKNAEIKLEFSANDICVMSPLVEDLDQDSKIGGESMHSEQSDLPAALEQLEEFVTKDNASGNYYVQMKGMNVGVMVPENNLDINDMAGLCPLGPEMTTSELINTLGVSNEEQEDAEMGMFSANVSDGAGSNDADVTASESKVPQLSEYTEEQMNEALKDAKETKLFPSIIKEGSEFHIEFLFRHFTRLSDESMISSANKAKWKEVIGKHLVVLSDTIGKMRCGAFKFQTVPGTTPVRQRMYPLSMVKKDALTKMIKVLLENDCIEPCKQTDWLSPILLISKGEGRWRLVVDYRKLNMMIVNEPVAYPRPDDIFETVQKAFFMFLIDGRDFYFQRELHVDCRPMTAFMTHIGAYQWKRCPQGLKPSSAAAINPVTNLFIDVLFNWALLHCDDLLGWAQDEEESIRRFDIVLTKFGEFGVTLGWFKVWILLNKAEYVSHVIEDGRVKPSPKMVDAIDRIPEQLKSVKEVQSFVGLTQYFALYIPMMAEFRTTLTNLTRKDVEFNFTPECVAAVRMLKRLLKRAVLYIVDYEREIFILTDASGRAMGGCVMQKNDAGHYIPLRFMSRGFDRYEQAQENREREMRAGWFTMLKAHSLLEHNVFTWYCDHSNVRWAMSAKAEHQRIARLALWLSMYYYNLQHMAGKHILLQIVDAISRLPIPDTAEDREIFVPFEAPEAQSILTSTLTDEVIVCPRHFELSTDTHAKLTRSGIEIRPNSIAGSHVAFQKRWRLVSTLYGPLRMFQKSVKIVEQWFDNKPLLFGVELFGKFLAATAAMEKSDISVCATVDTEPGLEDTGHRNNGVNNKEGCLHFQGMSPLIQALLSSFVEMPEISIIHATLTAHHSIQLRTNSRQEVLQKADQTLRLVSVLNSVQGYYPVLMVVMVVPTDWIGIAQKTVKPRASKLGYTTALLNVNSSNHGDYVSKQVQFLVLRKTVYHVDIDSYRNAIPMPTMRSFTAHAEPKDVYNMHDQGVTLSDISKSTKVQLCLHSGDHTGLSFRRGHRVDKARRLATIPNKKKDCFSVLAPMPSVKATLPCIVTNPSSHCSMWRTRQATTLEVCSAYSLTEQMKEESTSMPAPKLAALLSQTTPLATLTQFYNEVQGSISLYCNLHLKVGGNCIARDIAKSFVYNAVQTSDDRAEMDVIMIQRTALQVTQLGGFRDFKFQNQLPVKGELYTAVVYSGYGSCVDPIQSVLPGLQVVTFDWKDYPSFRPTIKGDYLKFDWSAFIALHGAPTAVIFMPPCSARSRQHPIGKHYDRNYMPVSQEAVNCDQCVDKAISDLKIIQRYNPDVQWAIENPHYTKFTALPSVQPFIEAGDYSIIQYRDYDHAFTVKRTIILHGLQYWQPRPLIARRNAKGVKWNASAGWNEKRRWSWPKALSTEIAEAILTWMRQDQNGPVINAMTKSMREAAKSKAASASKIASEAAEELLKMTDELKLGIDLFNEVAECSDDDNMDTHEAEVELEIDDSQKIHDTTNHDEVEHLLSNQVVLELQKRDAGIQSWIEVARLKGKVEELQNEIPLDTSALAKAQGAHHAAFISLRKPERGFVDHCFVNELDILVIANANKADPIPVITRSAGKQMIVLSHDQVSTLHSGSRKMHYWLIERCWWYGMFADIKAHVKTCLICQRMKFAASPGYGYQQMRWWNGPGKMVCIDLVVLTQSHASSSGSRYIFTILDCFSHYPDAYPLKVAGAADCASALYKWCSYNGVPQEIRADGGSNLNVSEIFQELYKLLGINSIVSNAYAPQANTVERFHRWLGAAMRILLYKYDLDVDESIPHCLWIWRATVCRMTGFTPFAIHCGRTMRFPRDLFEKDLADVTHTEYAKHLNELTTSLWIRARNAQRIAQIESAHYYNLKHGIKRDIRVGDLVLRKKIPTNPTDVPSHLLPRCTGPYRVLKINARGAIIEHATTGKTAKSSLRHIRPCIVRRDDAEYDEEGSLKFTAGEFAVVKMYKSSSTTDKWQLAKLLHLTPDEDAWVVQWCNTRDADPVNRMDRRFTLVWMKEDGCGNEELLQMNAKPGWIGMQWVVTLHRFLTPSFKLKSQGKLPAPIKAIIRSKFESVNW